MVKVGVIGLGAMGINHARVYHDIGVSLIAVADLDEARGKQCERRFQTTWVADYRQLLANPEIEAVSIAAPTFLHHQIASEALHAGKHVLVEKPICDTVEKANDLVALAEESNLVLSVGHIERYNPVVKAAKELLGRDVTGDILSVSSRRVSGGSARIHDVGVILDLAIHDIDVVRYLVGSEVSSVYAAAGRSTAPGAWEDRAHILVEFANGIFATLEASWRSPMKVRKLALTCSKSHIELDYAAQSLERSTLQFQEGDVTNLYTLPREYESHRVVIQNQEPLRNEIHDFLLSVEGKKKPLTSGKDGAIALEIAHAALKSARERRRIDIQI